MKKRKTKSKKPGAKAETEDKMDVATVTEKSVDKTEVLTENGKENVGICFTCNNRESCFNRARNEGVPIWFCENFDDSVPPGETYGKTIIYLAYAVLAEKSAANRTRLKGLCANCKNAAECKLSHKMGGVWHCEEYL